MKKKEIILNDNDAGIVILKLTDKGVAIHSNDEERLAVFETEEDVNIFANSVKELLNLKKIFKDEH